MMEWGLFQYHKYWEVFLTELYLNLTECGINLHVIIGW